MELNDQEKNFQTVINLIEGLNLTQLMGVTKYDPPEGDDGAPGNISKRKGNFPTFAYKTDEERVQNLSYVLKKYKGITFYISEKVDGSSQTVFLKDGEFGVCSRNFQIQEVEGNRNWESIKKQNIEEKLRTLGKNIVLQGELLSPGIQKNKYKLTEPEFLIFNVMDIDTGKFYDYVDFIKFCDDLQLKHVPILQDDFVLDHTMEQIIAMAEGKSVLNKDALREGLVFRPLIETYDHKLRRLSFKSINNSFLLKHNA